MHSQPTGPFIGALAEHLLSYRYQTWGYGESIAFDALLAATDAGAGERFATFAHGYFRGWAERARPYVETDNTIPGDALCECAGRFDDQLLVAAATQLSEWLVARPTGACGVFFSRGTVPLRDVRGVALEPWERQLIGDAGPGIFVDCLHFDPPFLANLGRLTGNTELINVAISQAVGYLQLLRDEQTGLLHHFWLARTGRPHILGWGRGQGWALLGLVRVLELIPAGYPSRKGLADGFVALAASVQKYQRNDGHWPVLLTDSDSGVESSTAAFVSAAFARGIALGLLDEGGYGATLQRAYKGMTRCLTSDGVLAGVSAAVGASTSSVHYTRIPVGGSMPWGQGPAILAASEIQRIGPKKESPRT